MKKSEQVNSFSDYKVITKPICKASVISVHSTTNIPLCALKFKQIFIHLKGWGYENGLIDYVSQVAFSDIFVEWPVYTSVCLKKFLLIDRVNKSWYIHV